MRFFLYLKYQKAMMRPRIIVQTVMEMKRAMRWILLSTKSRKQRRKDRSDSSPFYTVSTKSAMNRTIKF